MESYLPTATIISSKKAVSIEFYIESFDIKPNHLNIFILEMTSKQLYEENEVLCNSTYKLLKKYQAVRTIIKTLAVSKIIN